MTEQEPWYFESDIEVDEVDIQEIAKYTPVYVEWRDTTEYNPWVEGEFRLKKADSLIRSVGFYIETVDDMVQIVRSYKPDDALMEGILAIPKQMISKIKIIDKE